MFESVWCSKNEIRVHLMFYKMVFDPSLDLNHYGQIGHIYSAIFSRQDLSKFRYYFLTTIQKPTMNLGVVDSIWQVTSDCSALEIKKFLETGWELVPHYLSKTIFGGLPFWSHLRQSLQHQLCNYWNKERMLQILCVHCFQQLNFSCVGWMSV